MPLSREQRSTLILISTALIWGIGFVAQRAAVYYMGTFTFTGIRFGLGGLALIPLALFLEKGGLNKDALKAGLAAGVVLFCGASLQQWGIEITGSAGMAGFITGMYIIIVPILGIFMRRRTSRYVWLGAFIAFVGLYFISVTDGMGLVDFGSAVMLVGAFFWALHILVVDRFAAKVPPLSFSVAQCLVCAALSMAAAFAFEDVQPARIAAGYLPIMYSAFISVCIAYTLQIVGQKHVSPARSAVIFSMESVIAAIGEVILFGVSMEMRGYAGGGLIFLGILISQARRRQKHETDG